MEAASTVSPSVARFNDTPRSRESGSSTLETSDAPAAETATVGALRAARTGARRVERRREVMRAAGAAWAATQEEEVALTADIG